MLIPSRLSLHPSSRPIKSHTYGRPRGIRIRIRREELISRPVDTARLTFLCTPSQSQGTWPCHSSGPGGTRYEWTRHYVNESLTIAMSGSNGSSGLGLLSFSWMTAKTSMVSCHFRFPGKQLKSDAPVDSVTEGFH